MFGQRVALLIDGGHLRVLARKSGQTYDPDFIERFAMGCVAGDERLLRVLYYDCAPYNGSAKGPVSGNTIEFKGDDGWLRVLAAKDLFAIRLGVLKFRGWSPRKLPLQAAPLSDAILRRISNRKASTCGSALMLQLFPKANRWIGLFW